MIIEKRFGTVRCRMMMAFVTEAIGDTTCLPVKPLLKTTCDHAGRGVELVNDTDLILRRLPPGPREARPDDKLRKRLEGWTQRMRSPPSFETRARARSSG